MSYQFRLSGISYFRFRIYRKYSNEPIDAKSLYLAEIFRKGAENVKE